MVRPDVDGDDEEDCKIGRTDDSPDKSLTPAARLVPVLCASKRLIIADWRASI